MQIILALLLCATAVLGFSPEFRKVQFLSVSRFKSEQKRLRASTSDKGEFLFGSSSVHPDTDVDLFSDDDDPTNEVIREYRDELVSLRGTPELVDRLENLVKKHPGKSNLITLYWWFRV